MIQPLNYPEFREKTATGSCIVEFWAEWCTPCLKMIPLVEEVSEQFEGLISFYSVNVDDNRLLAREMRVGSVPTTLLLQDGREIERWQGLVRRIS